MQSDSTNRTQLPLLPALLLVFAPLFWAGNFVLARAMHAAIPPIAMAFWRWALALIILLPFGLPHVRRQWSMIRGEFPLLILLGVLGVGSFNTLAYLGLQTTTATNGVVLNSAIPILILGLSRVFFGQRLSPRQLVGALISLLGVWFLIFQGDPALMRQMRINQGDLWVLAAVACWAVYTLLLRKVRTPFHPLTFLTVTLSVGVTAIFPLFIGEYLGGARFSPTPGNLATIGYMAVFASLAAYLCWNRGVTALGPARAGLFIHLMPIFGTLFSVAFLGESFHPFHAISMATILLGIYLTQKS